MSTPRVRRSSLVLTALMVVSMVAATAAVAQGRGTPARATKTVRAIVTHWTPTTVRISTGDVIKWRGVSGTHTVTAYGNWSYNRDLSTGDVVHRTFRRAGTFKFRCQFHSTLTNGQCSGMCGKVVVTS
jgi:plastocyanin